MSASKWAYEPDICDGEPCVGDCDNCRLAEEAENEDWEGEDWNDPDGFDMWRNGMVRHPKRFINPRILTGKW